MNIATAEQQPCAARSYAAIADYWALTKPDINLLIGIVTFAGFYLGMPAAPHDAFLLLIHTLVGTVLVSSGASALNQFMERGFDARMRRTARRPLAAGKLEPSAALTFGLMLSLTGLLDLAFAVNLLASMLSLIALASYLFLYTPLKRRTQWCTLAGAFSGALPPLIGWAGASGRLSLEAWVLYLMLFLWQFPHFMAIAWMYREDYARAGYLVLPRGDVGARFMSWQAVLPALALIPLGVMAGSGPGYRISTCIAGMVFSYYSARMAFEGTNVAAKRLLMVSIIYAPVAFGMIMLDQV